MKEIDETRLNDINYIKSWVYKLLEVEDHKDATDTLRYIYKYYLSDAPNSLNENYLTLFPSVKETGQEGGGEECQMIFAIASSDTKTISHLNSVEIENALVYFRINGYFNSYEGTTWDSDWEIVTPNIVTTLSFARR